MAMNGIRFSALSFVLALGFSGLMAACSGDAPSSHSVSLGGIKHPDGFADPLVHCVECHGATLAGGGGPSCYHCHNAADHAVVRGGVAHRDGAPAACAACHGPNNAGGVGPSCTTCHP
jgi:hypothetical protein